MAIIYKKPQTVFLENEEKKDAKKKSVGLGRTFDSLLEDNSPASSVKPNVIRRNDTAERENQRRSSDDLYKKEGVLNVQKSKRIR